MLQSEIARALSRQLDRLVLYSLNRRIPDSFEQSYAQAPPLEQVLAETQVNRRKTAVYNLTAPGEHNVWLDTPLGEIGCHVRVWPAINPAAPLLLYHHGLGEVPYYSTWQRIAPKSNPLPVHAACVQAPFHTDLNEPLQKGFASIQHTYQMFAGSLRIMATLQERFHQEGSAFTLAAGLSWGGVTSILYGSLIQKAHAIAPLYASPDLAQVLWHTAARFNRSLSVPRESVDAYFDLTSYLQQCDQRRMFPLLGQHDQFFPFDYHARVFREQETAVASVASGHVGSAWSQRAAIRRHLLDVLQRAQNLPAP